MLIQNISSWSDETFDKQIDRIFRLSFFLGKNQFYPDLNLHNTIYYIYFHSLLWIFSFIHICYLWSFFHAVEAYAVLIDVLMFFSVENLLVHNVTSVLNIIFMVHIHTNIYVYILTLLCWKFIRAYILAGRRILNSFSLNS